MKTLLDGKSSIIDGKIVLFDIHDIVKERSSSNRLVFNSCKAIIYDKTYSEFDEMTFANLNHNDYGFGYIEYEFSFKESFNTPYMEFFVSCFAFRMNLLGYPIKLNGLRPPKARRLRELLTPPTYTKVNKYGEMSFGIRFFFRSLEERDAMLNCDRLCIEGNVSFGGKRNVYDIMCRIKKENDDWIVDEANTYRTHKNYHIYSLYH